MKKQSSYIFLQHPSKKKKIEKEDGTIVIEMGTNVCSFILQAFPSVKSIEDKTDIFIKQCKGDISDCSVVFIIHEVTSNICPRWDRQFRSRDNIRNIHQHKLVEIIIHEADEN